MKGRYYIISTEKAKVKKLKKRNFVDNKQFLVLIKEYHESGNGTDGYCKRNRRMSEELGKVFITMANNLAFSRQFINYSVDWKNDMKSDAIFHCVKYVGTFNIEKGQNPFAYFTTVITNAFIQRIKKEKLGHERIDMIKDRIWKDFQQMYGFYDPNEQTNNSMDEH